MRVNYNSTNVSGTETVLLVRVSLLEWFSFLLTFRRSQYLDSSRLLALCHTPQKVVEKHNHKTVDVGGLWNMPDVEGGKDDLQAGRIVVRLSNKPLVLTTAASGMRC